MATKIELQKQLLAEQKKLAAETAALNTLNNKQGKIQADISRIKSTIETADEKFHRDLFEKHSSLEKEAANRQMEADLANRNIEQHKLDIETLQKELDNSKDFAEDELYAYTQKVNALNDKYPVLLFPVRPETRFHSADAVRELWVRIYPDTIQSEIQRSYLTTQELNSAIAYVENSSYDLVDIHGPNRGNFIKQWVDTYKGTPNFLQILRRGDRAEIKLKFNVDITTYTPAPQALTLPNRFVFRLYDAAGNEARTEIGKAVPASVFMGVSPGNSTGIEWITNFQEAINVGLGIKITLSNDEYNNGFSKLVVLGIRVDSNVAESQALLENLVQNHQYSHKGFSLIKQGTITNNSDDEATTYSGQINMLGKGGNPPPAPPSPPPPPTNTEEGSIGFGDGLWLSQYLGINDSITQKISTAQDTDQQNARAMNTALFPATLGYFLNEMLDPLLTDEEISRIESFFNKYVLGRGTIPAVRIGKQPYGIMPASVLPKLNLQASDPVRNEIVTKVQELFGFWKEESKKVKHIGNDAPVSTDDFLDILSLHPNSVSFQQRMLEDMGPKLNAVSSGLANDSILGNLNDWLEESYLQSSGLAEKLKAAGLDPNTQRPDILYKVFTKAVLLNGPVVEPAFDGNGQPIKEAFSETEGLKFNYIKWLATSDFDTIRNETGVPYQKKPLLYLFLRHAIMLRHAEAAAMFEKTAFATTSTDIKSKYRDNQLIDSLDKSKTALLYRVDEKITGSKTLPLKDYITNKLTTDATMPVELVNLNNIRSALLSIAELPTAKLERTFVEHIDCCSYRIDAWINALYSVQIRKQRLQTGDTWSKGIYLGAFAYLEDLKPKEATGSEGYILAPSLSHASAAAILRNAQLTYQGNEKNPFNINISSDRVREATLLLDGIRRGLALNELLGYRFERRMHEFAEQNNISLERYIYDYRIKYPLAQAQNSQQSGPQESISARNVVDGQKLLAAFEANEEDVFTDITEIFEEKQAIRSIIRSLQDIIDAVKDLMMTEGVYQAVHSNYERGSGVLDSLNQGKFMPELQVIETPRNGALLTHRVALHVNYKETAGVTNSLRATLEPSINSWLKSVFPDPTNVVVNINRTEGGEEEYLTQKELGLEPIDLLYLMNIDSNQALTALDDIILAHLSAGKVHSIRYKAKKDSLQYTFFELAALIRPLRKMVLQSRYLAGSDLTTKSDSTTALNRLSANNLSRLNELYNILNQLDLSYFDNLSNKTQEDVRIKLSALTKTINLHFDNHVSFGALLEKLLKPNLTPQEFEQVKQDITTLIAIVRTKLNAQKTGLAGVITKVRTEVERGEGVPAVYGYNSFIADLKSVLGDDVIMLPLFKIPQNVIGDFRNSVTNYRNLLRYSIDTLHKDFPVHDWISSTARVREKMFAVETVMNAVELIKGTKLYCTPTQLPYTATDRWFAVQFALGNENYAVRDKLLYTILSEDTKLDEGVPDNDIFCGLLIDDWTEIVPGKEEKAGLSFQYNKPNVEAPQTMLLVTPPEIKGNWSHDDIVDAVLSTIEVVKARAVEPDHLADTPIAQFTPATVMYASLYDTSVTTNLAQNSLSG